MFYELLVNSVKLCCCLECLAAVTSHCHVSSREMCTEMFYRRPCRPGDSLCLEWRVHCWSQICYASTESERMWKISHVFISIFL